MLIGKHIQLTRNHWLAPIFSLWLSDEVISITILGFHIGWWFKTNEE